MSPNRRIFLNIIATYGRSLYALVLGLFTARWALQALGKSDYGLYGLVGGMAMMVTFLNSLLATAVSRFYAVSVGATKKKGNERAGLEECRQWFNTAMSIHTALPLILLVIGYPVGIWAVKNFLTIPSDRVADCVCVWRCSCVSCLIAMMNVPFVAMYTAKQEIAERTLFSLFTTTGNAIFLYWMVMHPGVWLAKYAVGICVIGIVPQIAISVRAMIKYKECRIIGRYWYNATRYVQLAKFAIAKFWSDFAAMVSLQGYAILVNKFMGATYNASMTVGSSVTTHAATLSSSMSGAFAPAISNLCGENRMEEVKKLSFVACRMGAVLLLIFAVPVVLEVDEILRLWLVTPPDFAAVLCVAALFRLAFDKMTDGYWMAIYGKGYKVMKYSWTVGWAGIVGVGVAVVLFMFGFGMWSIVWAWMISRFVVVAVRLCYGRELVDFDVAYWTNRVFLPICATAALSLATGYCTRFFIGESFLRILITTVVCEAVLLPLAWSWVFEEGERNRVVGLWRRMLAIRNYE